MKFIWKDYSWGKIAFIVWLINVIGLNISAQHLTDSLYVHPKNFILDEMVISGSRWEQNIREIPNRISKINSSSIQFQNLQTAADVVGSTNQVFIQKSQLGGGSPIIRGFATNRVLLVVDGVRMNNAIFRSGNVQNVISLDAQSIEDAEVLFGPGSVIYGSDAIGGVMDFHTLRPHLQVQETPLFSINALARYSSANHEKTTHIDFNIGCKKWAFRTSVTYADYDDLKMGSKGKVEYSRPDYVVRENNEDVVHINADANVQKFSGYGQFNALQKIMFQPNAFWNLTYGFHYSKTSDYARYDRLLLRKEDDSPTSAEWYYGPQKWTMHSLAITSSRQSFMSDQVRFTIAYQDYQESRHNRNFGASLRTNRFEHVKAISLNVDLDKEITDRLFLFYGLELVSNNVGSKAYRNNIDNEEVFNISTRYPNGSVWRTYAVYLSGRYKLSAKWLLNSSGRFTNVYTHAKFDNTFFDFPFSESTIQTSALNGSVGLIFNPTNLLKLYGNLSTGFRAPNVDDIGKVFDSTPGNVIVPNPELKPEKALGFELGSTGNFGRSVKFDFSVFHSVINNAIGRGSTTFNGYDSIDFDGQLSRVQSHQNISKLYVYGIQLGMEGQLSNELTVTFNFNWQTGKERDPETGRNFSPTHIAPIFGAAHIIYQKYKFKADLYTNYSGEISFHNLALTERADAHLYAHDKAGNPYSPAWGTLNLKGSFKPIRNLTVDAGIENILDKRYRPYSSGISAPGRNFIAAVRVSF